MSMSPERRAEIVASLAAADQIHPGPWFAVPITDDDPEIPTKDLPCIPHPHWDLCCGDKEHPSNVACILTDYDDEGVKGHEDINFIVGARQWVPELLEENRALRLLLDERTRQNEALIVKALDATEIEARWRDIVVDARTARDKADLEVERLAAANRKLTIDLQIAESEARAFHGRDAMRYDHIRELERRIESKDAEIAGLKAQLAEWEKYTGFLYAHGFFLDRPNAAMDSSLTSTEDKPHV